MISSAEKPINWTGNFALNILLQLYFNFTLLFKSQDIETQLEPNKFT